MIIQRRRRVVTGGSALELMPEGDPRHTDITVRRAIAFSRLSHAVFEEGVRWERDAEQL
jgi:hypothetical protein